MHIPEREHLSLCSPTFRERYGIYRFNFDFQFRFDLNTLPSDPHALKVCAVRITTLYIMEGSSEPGASYARRSEYTVPSV